MKTTALKVHTLTQIAGLDEAGVSLVHALHNQLGVESAEQLLGLLCALGDTPLYESLPGASPDTWKFVIDGAKTAVGTQYFAELEIESQRLKMHPHGSGLLVSSGKVPVGHLEKQLTRERESSDGRNPLPGR